MQYDRNLILKLADISKKTQKRMKKSSPGASNKPVKQLSTKKKSTYSQPALKINILKQAVIEKLANRKNFIPGILSVMGVAGLTTGLPKVHQAGKRFAQTMSKKPYKENGPSPYLAKRYNKLRRKGISVGDSAQYATLEEKAMWGQDKGTPLHLPRMEIGERFEHLYRTRGR